MIYCSIHIDYVSQFKRCQYPGVQELIDSLSAITLSLGGQLPTREEQLCFAFPKTGPFGLLQCAEAVRQYRQALTRSGEGLRGASICLHLEDDNLERLEEVRLRRHRDRGADRVFASPAVGRLLKDHFQGGSGLELAACRYDWLLSGPDLSPLALRPGLQKALRSFLDRPDATGKRLLYVKAEPLPRSVAALRGLFDSDQDTLLLTLYCPARSSRPFQPFTGALSRELLDRAAERADVPTAQRLEALRPAFEYLRSALGQNRLPPAMEGQAAEFINLSLDLLGQTGSSLWLLCDRPEYFCEAAKALIASRLANPAAAERYLAISALAPPEPWLEAGAEELFAVSGPLEDIEGLLAGCRQAVEEGGGQEDSQRLLDTACQLVRQPDAQAGAEYLQRLLPLLPPEAGLYLYLRHLSGDGLDEAEFARLLQDCGLEISGAQLMESMLSRCAVLDPLAPDHCLLELSTEQWLGLLSPKQRHPLEAHFTAHLLSLFGKRRLSPSLPLLERLGENRTHERFVYASIMHDALYSESREEVQTAFLSPFSRAIHGFYAAARPGMQKAQNSALIKAGDHTAGERGGCLLALMHAEFAYATGSVDSLSKNSRAALLQIGRNAPPSMEARIQRMMGLSALSLEKFNDAIDYINNAAEIAEAGGEAYELSHAFYAKALTEFMNGALVRAGRSAAQAADWSKRICRPDLSIGQELLLARLDMELGLYDAAARRFAEQSEAADGLDLPLLGRRAKIWQARCMGYGEQFNKAMAILQAAGEDSEARLFTAELELLRGRPEEAVRWLSEEPESLPRDFLPPDSLNVSSLFQEHEGRCIGFDQANGLLKDMRQALWAFAKGLCTGDPRYASDLSELSRNPRIARSNPAHATFCMYGYLLEENQQSGTIDLQTILSRAFKAMQQRAGRIEDRASRGLFMEKNIWNRRLLAAAREHKFL